MKPAISAFAAPHAAPAALKKVSTTTSIRAPADVIWRILTDAPGWGLWNPEITRIDGRIALGERVTLYRHAEPRVATVRVSAFEPARRLAFAGGGGMAEQVLKAERVYTLTTAEDGLVEFSQQLVFSGLMAGLIIRNIPDQQPVLIEVGLALKQYAERTPH